MAKSDDDGKRWQYELKGGGHDVVATPPRAAKVKSILRVVQPATTGRSV